MLDTIFMISNFIFMMIGAMVCIFILLVWLNILKDNDKINKEYLDKKKAKG